MSRTKATFIERDIHTIDFVSRTPRKHSDPLVSAAKAFTLLTEMGINCSTPAAIFDELDRRGLTFTVNGPVHFVARIDYFDVNDPNMQKHEELGMASALSLVGALAVAFWCVLRDYPEHREVKREPRRYPTN